MTVQRGDVRIIQELQNSCTTPAVPKCCDFAQSNVLHNTNETLLLLLLLAAADCAGHQQLQG
jgi:hypothetical protein